jgi:exopolysaccharide production protein ExoZ
MRDFGASDRMPPRSVPRKFDSIQYLRALAAATVVLFHAESQLQRFQPGLEFKEWGAIAVDIFFVISGFVMWHMMMSSAPVSFGEYWRRRFARLIPFYWLITSIVVAIMVAAPNLLSSSHFDAAHVLASYLFLPWLHPVLRGEFAPLIIPGWTLNYDMAFYVVLGFALFLPLRWRAAAVIGTILCVALLPAFIHSSSPLYFFYTQPIILDFASGVLIGWMIWNGVRLSASAALLWIAIGVAGAALATAPTHVVPEIGGYGFMLAREMAYLVPSFAIVAGAVFFDAAYPDAWHWKFLVRVGDATYSIYIVHVLVLPVVTRAWRFTGLETNAHWNAAYVMLALAASVGAGLVSYRYAEMPLYRFVDRLTKPHAPRKVLVPAAA